MYKYEMHLHSCRTSGCAVSEAEAYIQAALDRGFSGMVFTNHFYGGNTAVGRKLSWRDFVSVYAEEFYRVKKFSQGLGIDVLFGLEEGYGNGKECLIYGLTPEIIADCSDFPRFSIAEISAFVRENGGLIACAHPFRHRAYITDPEAEPNPEYFDAVEVYNRYNSFEENLMAERFARKYSLLPICGGDTHGVDDFGYCGIAFEKKVENGAEFVKLLKSGKYRLCADNARENAGNLFDYI